MAVEEGLRRSTRARKQVKSYAAEQAENEDAATDKKPVTKRKRKHTVEQVDHEERDEDYNNDDLVQELAPIKKSKKKKSVEKDPATRVDGSIKKGLSLFFEGGNNAAEGATWFASAAERNIAASRRNLKKLKPGEKEIRLASFVDDPSATYKKALKKANSERMFILNRERGVDDCHAGHDDCPMETLEIAGSTGNVYTVKITHMPTCSCPVGIFKGRSNETLCKHTLYILHNVLKVPDHLKQQNAFLTSELKEIFQNAAPLASVEAASIDTEADGGRKAIEGDCPICFMEFEEGEDIVWCRAACGNNIHKGCFDQWAGTRVYNVTCPFCRSTWQDEAPNKTQTQRVDVVDVEIPETRGKGGYRNVRALLDYGD